LFLVCASSAAILTSAATADGAALGCGTTITTSTTLTSDIRGCVADGLVVAGDGVTLDLANHTISGTGQGVGIRIVGSGITVKNGSVDSFGTGIRTTPEVSFASKIVDVAVSRNAGDGVDLIAFSGLIRDSTIMLNAANGIQLGGAAASTVTGNIVFRNGAVGILGSPHSDGVTYRNNNVFENGGDGIFALESTSTFAGNMSRRNGGNGIEVRESSGPGFPPSYVFVGNVTDDNAAHGIYACFANFLGGRQCDGGFTDGGGNVARRNGLDPQCVNVSCAFNPGRR
jgi:hypothetical protein